MTAKEKITNAELEIMQIVWDSSDSIPFREICEKLQNGAKKVTVQTLISRLLEKGALRQEKRDVYYYSPLVTRQEYEQSKTEELIQKVYRGDVKKLFSVLLDNDSIPGQDLKELRRFWQEVNGDA